MSRRTLLAALIVLLAVATTWFSRQSRPPAPEQAAAPQHVADYFLEGFTATTMDAAGRPHRRLQAANLIHYGDDDTMDVTRPDLLLYQQHTPPWRVLSNTAHLIDSQDRAWLRGNVRMRHRGPQGKETTVTTAWLLLHPKANYAETDAKATIDYPNASQHGIGMDAWLGREAMVLRSRVRGVYVPQS